MCPGVFCRVMFHELIGLADVFIHVSMGPSLKHASLEFFCFAMF